MTNHQAAKFIPALGNDLLTPLYDPLLWFMRESRFKGDLIEQAQISKGNRVLDVGCGTGTLAIMIKELHPEAEVVGIDAGSRYGRPTPLRGWLIRPRPIKSVLASSFN